MATGISYRVSFRFCPVTTMAEEFFSASAVCVVTAISGGEVDAGDAISFDWEQAVTSEIDSPAVSIR
jgi:hypothetical protein